MEQLTSVDEMYLELWKRNAVFAVRKRIERKI